MKNTTAASFTIASLLFAADAAAECALDGDTFLCTGATRGSVILENNSRVEVSAGASLLNIPSNIIFGFCPLSPPVISVGNNSTVINNGAILGFGTCGIGVIAEDNATVISRGTIDTVNSAAQGIVIGRNSRIELYNALVTRGDTSQGISGTHEVNVLIGANGSILTRGTAAAGIFLGENASIINDGAINTFAIDAPAIYIVDDPIRLGPTTAVIRNHGLMEAAGARTDTLRIASDDITLINSGQIKGLFLDSPRPSDYSRAALLEGKNVTVANTGSIAGAVSGLTIDATVSASVMNTGTLSANIGVGRALNLESNTASLTNNGLISGRLSGARIAVQQTADIVNSGTIELTDGISLDPSFAALAIESPTTGRISLNNTGDIIAPEGRIAFSASDGIDTISNAGRMIGRVELGASDDVLILQANAVLRGHLDGGAGNDRLVLLDRGTLEATASNLEDVFVLANTRWAVHQNFNVSRVAGVFEGELNITAGRTLSAPSIVVADGAILGGAGRVQGSVNALGTLSPNAENSNIGTLTIDGNLTQSATSVYRVDVAAPGSTDKIAVTGTAQLDGTLSVVRTANTRLRGTERYEILSAQGGITGTFARILGGSSAFITATIETSADQRALSLILSRLPYASVASGPVQQDIASVLDTALSSGRTGLAPLFDRLDAGDTAAARAAFNQLAVPLPTANFTTADTSARAAWRTLIKHPQTDGRGVWGVYQNTAGGPSLADGLNSYHFNISGVTAGADARLGEDAVLSLAVSQQRGKLSYRTESRAQAEIDHTFVMGQISHAWGAWELAGSVLWGDGDIVSSRRASDPTVFNVTGTTDARATGAKMTSTHTAEFGAFLMNTSAGIDVLRTSLKAYTETGTLPFTVGAQAQTSVRPGLEVQFSAAHGPYFPYVGIGVSYEAASRLSAAHAAFADDPATSFTLRGARPERAWLSLDAGLNLPLSDHLAINVGVHMSPHDATRGQSVFAGAAWRW